MALPAPVIGKMMPRSNPPITRFGGRLANPNRGVGRLFEDCKYLQK
jgi:hypothetical protein